MKAKTHQERLEIAFIEDTIRSMKEFQYLMDENINLRKQVDLLQHRIDEKEEAEIFQAIDSLDQERESERQREWFESQQDDWM